MSTPLGYRGGGSAWAVDRTIAMDRQIFGANQHACHVTVRRRGNGAGREQMAHDGILTRTLTLTPAGSTYVLAVLKSGPLNRTDQIALAEDAEQAEQV